MPARFRQRLTYANVVATLALFVALGGGSYAAVSITGKNVKNNSLTGRDVKNNSLTGSDIKKIRSGDVSDRSLLAKDFKAGQLPAGAKGDKGDPATRLFASVTDSGELVLHGGAIGAHRNSAGQYTVTFDRNLTGCLPVVSSGEGQPGAGVGGNSFNTVPLYAYTDDAVRTKVNVVTGADGATDNGFALALFC